MFYKKILFRLFHLKFHI